MSEITITRQELLQFWSGLPTVAALKGFKLGYAVARTKAKIRPEVEALEESVRPAKDFERYEVKRLALCLKHAKKNDQGTPVIAGDQYIFGDNQEAFETEIAPLSEEYAGAIEDRRRQLEDYQAGLKETITVAVHQVLPEDVPEEVNGAQMGVLYYLIKET